LRHGFMVNALGALLVIGQLSVRQIHEAHCKSADTGCTLRGHRVAGSDYSSDQPGWTNGHAGRALPCSTRTRIHPFRAVVLCLSRMATHHFISRCILGSVVVRVGKLLMVLEDHSAPNKMLDLMTRSAVTPVFQSTPHRRAPRHRSAFR
jgi:hypothetical protein